MEKNDLALNYNCFLKIKIKFENILEKRPIYIILKILRIQN